MRLQGRAAFVTRRLRRSRRRNLPSELARAGCDIAVGYVGNREGAEKVVRVVEGLGRRAAMGAGGSGGGRGHRAHGAVRAAAALGRLDILVNNAGWNIGIPFPELDALTVEIWDRLHDTNVRGPFLLAKAAAGTCASGRRAYS